MLGGVGPDSGWGVHQHREMADGRIIATIRDDPTLIDGRNHTSAIGIFQPGLTQCSRI